MNALHDQFVTEARELIQQAAGDLIDTEREGFASERINRIFRAFHTLKGSAGVVDLPAMGLALHAAEDLLAAVVAGRLVLNPAIVDQALACLDQVSRWVDAFEARETLPAGAGDTARAMAEGLRSHLAADGSKALPEPAGRPAAPAADGALPDWVSRLLESARGEMSREAGTRPKLVAVSYEPHAGCFFDGDDPLTLMQRIPNLLAFHVEARDAWPTLAEFNPYACNLRLQALSAAGREAVSVIFRLVPDQVRLIEVPPEAARIGQDASTSADTTAFIRTVIEEQRAILRLDVGDDGVAGRDGSVLRVVLNALRHDRRQDLARQVADSATEATARGDTAPLRLALDETLKVLALSPSPSPSPSHSAPDGKSPDTGASDPVPGEPARGASRLLRVDEARVDALVNLAGELVVFKNSFAHLVRRLTEDGGVEPEAARAARHEYQSIERLAGEMHSAILHLRMVPVAPVFQSFPRLVRDMSRRLEKTVSFVTRGEMVESDKVIVDRLFEPLLHLLRNALDHGIEPASQRRSAGKPEVATITMQASRLGDRLVVEVIDDGRGIDPDVVRRKARERGMMAPEELASLSDGQVIDLIFSAGFSTATEVSDISGRGVGMDVVRTTIGQIGGRVSVTSRVGAGATVRLDLPLTVAMSRIMVVEAGGQVFGVPMDAVTETVRVPEERIRRIKTNRGFVLRDRVVPICSLAELMGLDSQSRARPGESLLVVAEVNGTVTALEVDAISDRLEVVLKPMQGVLANARGYAGTTLMGDGRVLLVLDFGDILP